MKNTEKKEVIKKINVKIFLYRVLIDAYKETNEELDKKTNLDHIDKFNQGWARATQKMLERIVAELIDVKSMIKNM